MEETKRTFADDEGEETMVAPRFDDEETVLARPVVPFEDVGDAPAVAPTSATSATSAASTTVAPPPYSGKRATPRRSLVAALVVVSALVGSVLGVAGLYFYQNRKSADATETQRQQAEAPDAQPTTETVSESRGGEPSAPVAESQPPAPVPAAAEPEADDDDADTARDKDSDEADAAPVAERRRPSEDREPVTTPKRGKKGARDEEVQRGAQRAPRYDVDDRPVARDEVSGDDRREARRVGVITYRPRRSRPRRDRYDTPDRLRRIFEGEP
jgi:hypothetical protein